MAIGRIGFLLGCWTEGLRPSLAVGWRLSPVPWHCETLPRVAHSAVANLHESEQAGEQERASKTEA